MSLSVNGSRFVRVYDPTIDLKYSDHVVKARIVTSRKTGRKMTDKETGEILLDNKGQEREERAYSEFPAQFVGGAFESAKGLHGQTIDIVSGWIIMEKFKGRQDGITRSVPCVFISDFVLSDLKEADEPEEPGDTV